MASAQRELDAISPAQLRRSAACLTLVLEVYIDPNFRAQAGTLQAEFQGGCTAEDRAPGASPHPGALAALLDSTRDRLETKSSESARFGVHSLASLENLLEPLLQQLLHAAVCLHSRVSEPGAWSLG